jgi:hypothetical protein
MTCTLWTRVLGWVEDVLRDVRRVVPAVLVVREPVDAGLRLVVVRLVVVAGFCSPGVLIAMGNGLSTNGSNEGIGAQPDPYRNIEHVFVNHSVAPVTADRMKNS